MTNIFRPAFNSAFALICLMCLISCDLAPFHFDKKDAIDSIEVVRFDRVEARYVTTGDFSALQEMNTSYPMQTRALIEDLLQLGSVSDINISDTLLDFFQDSTLQVIVFAAESQYADMDGLTKELRGAFRNLKKIFPKAEIPRFYAQIGALNQSIVVDNDAIGISLDKYLGADFPAYGRFFDSSQRAAMTSSYIVPDVIVFYLLSRYGMFEFARTSQHWRDVNSGIIMYVANKLTGREAFKSEYVDRVAAFMRKNPDMSLKTLLEMTDYSEI